MYQFNFIIDSEQRQKEKLTQAIQWLRQLEPEHRYTVSILDFPPTLANDRLYDHVTVIFIDNDAIRESLAAEFRDEKVFTSVSSLKELSSSSS